MTTFWVQNPSFRVWEMDKETLVPVNAYNYFFDIKHPEQGWQLHYSLKEEYDLPDLSPNSMIDLGKRVAADKDLAVKVHNNMYQRYDLFESISDWFHTDLACKMQSSSPLDAVDCRGQMPLSPITQPFLWVFEGLQGTYYDVDPSSTIGQARANWKNATRE